MFSDERYKVLVLATRQRRIHKIFTLYIYEKALATVEYFDIDTLFKRKKESKGHTTYSTHVAKSIDFV